MIYHPLKNRLASLGLVESLRDGLFVGGLRPCGLASARSRLLVRRRRLRHDIQAVDSYRGGRGIPPLRLRRGGLNMALAM